MDPVNQKILELIRNNARMSYSDIGKSVGISRRYLRNMRKFLQIRNLGARSADEIMKALMKFQCSLLPAEEQQNYIRRVEEMSMEACHERKDESRKSF